MQKFELIVVALDDAVSDEVRRAWTAAGVHLAGPFTPDLVDFDALRRTGGVLMDLSLDPTTLFTLSERLMALQIPFLFIVARHEVHGSVHPFILSKDQESRDAILDALAREAREYTPTLRH